MAEQKLQAIGKDVGVTGKDVKGIKACGCTNKIVCAIVAAVAAVVAAVIGFIAGSGACAECAPCPDLSTDGYPYAAGLMIPAVLGAKSKASKAAVLVVAALALLIAIKAPAVFGQSVKYSVYRAR